jgi:hypothetical protein
VRRNLESKNSGTPGVHDSSHADHYNSNAQDAQDPASASASDPSNYFKNRLHELSTVWSSSMDCDDQSESNSDAKAKAKASNRPNDPIRHVYHSNVSLL